MSGSHRSTVSSGAERNLVTSSRRIPELDGLRGVAILMVVVCHYIAASNLSPLSTVPRRFLRLFSVGWSGVDLFFVLSGFLIGGILLESRKSPRYFRTFYLRRVYRILPIYYSSILLFLLFVAFLQVLQPVGSRAIQNLVHLPYYIVFLQNFILYKAPLELIWFGVTWSLAVEEQFYLCAPLVIRYLSTRKLIFTLATVIFAAPLLRMVICLFFSEYYHLVTFATPCRADALAYGMLAAIVYRHQGFHDYLWGHPGVLLRSLLILFGGLLVLTYWMVRPAGIVIGTLGYSYLALFYSCLLLFVLYSPGSWLAGIMRSRGLRNLGMISYCIYIIHVPINIAAHWLLRHDGIQFYNLRGVSVTLLAAVLSWLFAMLSWFLFEKPLVRRGHRHTY